MDHTQDSTMPRLPKRFCASLAATCASLFAAHCADAANVIFDDIDPHGGYMSDTGYLVAGPDAAGGPVTVSTMIEGGANAPLNEIDLGFAYVSGANSFTVSVWTATPGTEPTPGTELASWNFANAPTFGSTSTQVVTLANLSGPTLDADAFYFFQISAAGSSVGEWNESYGGTGLILSNQTSMSGNLPAFITKTNSVVPTPLPASLWLMLSGFGVLGLVGRKRAISRA
jgi:hypothetical protein